MSASWVVVSRATGKAVLETYSRDVARKVDTSRYEVLPVLIYLARLNRTLREDVDA